MRPPTRQKREKRGYKPWEPKMSVDPVVYIRGTILLQAIKHNQVICSASTSNGPGLFQGMQAAAEFGAFHKGTAGLGGLGLIHNDSFLGSGRTSFRQERAFRVLGKPT